MKIYAAFITYHPDSDLFSRALKSIEHQVEKVIIIDNTEHNEGIAKALNKAFAQAQDEGCDYLVTMDQDSVAPEGMVKALLSAVLSDKKIGQCGPAYDPKMIFDGPVQVDHVITSGALTSVQAWKDAGGFKDELFIDMVDVEFSFHIASLGYKILMLGNVYMEHHLGDGLVGIPFMGKVHFGYVDHAPFRWYYMTRNTLILRRMYRNEFPGPTAQAVKRIRKNIFRMLIAGKQRWPRIKMVIKGIKDSKLGNLH